MVTTNADEVAAALVESGTEIAFGLPGGEITLLLDACRRAGIRFFLTGHEASAAFMADVTGQITGRPGVCLATLGPGAVNLALGVSNALLDRSLAITAQLDGAGTPLSPPAPAVGSVFCVDYKVEPDAQRSWYCRDRPPRRRDGHRRTAGARAPRAAE